MVRMLIEQDLTQQSEGGSSLRRGLNSGISGFHPFAYFQMIHYTVSVLKRFSSGASSHRRFNPRIEPVHQPLLSSCPELISRAVILKTYLDFKIALIAFKFFT